MNLWLWQCVVLWFGVIYIIAHMMRMNTIEHNNNAMLLLIDSLHKKGAHNQFHSAANYKAMT